MRWLKRGWNPWASSRCSDEMEINIAPTLLGSGEALFDGVGDDLHGLKLARTVATPAVTHLKFERRKP